MFLPQCAPFFSSFLQDNLVKFVLWICGTEKKKQRKNSDPLCCKTCAHVLRLQNPLTSPLSWPSRPGEIGGLSEASACNLFKKKLWIIVPQYESGWLIACDKSCCVLPLSLSLQGLLPQPADSPNHPSVPSNTPQCTCARVCVCAQQCAALRERKEKGGKKKKFLVGFSLRWMVNVNPSCDLDALTTVTDGWPVHTIRALFHAGCAKKNCGMINDAYLIEK